MGGVAVHKQKETVATRWGKVRKIVIHTTLCTLILWWPWILGHHFTIIGNVVDFVCHEPVLLKRIHLNGCIAEFHPDSKVGTTLYSKINNTWKVHLNGLHILEAYLTESKTQQWATPYKHHLTNHNSTTGEYYSEVLQDFIHRPWKKVLELLFTSLLGTMLWMSVPSQSVTVNFSQPQSSPGLFPHWEKPWGRGWILVF